MGAGKDGKTRVVIIGAGIGGVSTAARLAKAGLEVIVVEKVKADFERSPSRLSQAESASVPQQNDYSGGRCSLLYTKDENGNKFR